MDMDDDMGEVPIYGWKARLNYSFPRKRSQFRIYNLQQIIPMLKLVFRYIVEYIWKRLHCRRPVMNFLAPASCDQQSGVPMGGIGGGTIGRGFRGEFSRFQIIPGIYEFPSKTVEVAQFIVNIQNADNKTVYQRVLSCQRKPWGKLSSWKWNFPSRDAEYTGLYPRAWTVFNIPDYNVKLICRQTSPVIPHNYKDSSIPGAVFHWSVYSFDKEPKYVSITFTFKSGVGYKRHKAENIRTQTFEKTSEQNYVCGYLIKQDVNNFPLTYGVGALKKKDNTVTSMTFNPNGNGKKIWDKLKADGELIPVTSSKENAENNEIACGLCTRSALVPERPSRMVFAITWDNPFVTFPLGSTVHRRYYTKYFGDSGEAAPDMCLYCIDNYPRWETTLDNWQATVLADDDLPDWYKSALFNELYYISDGGTVWLLPGEDEDLADGDPRKEFGRFAYLEGHEYRMWNTYDVHFYASFALALLWPKLQLSLQYDFRDSIPVEDTTMQWFLYNGQHGYRKVKNTVPHDLGDPEENPFASINSYNIHDVSNWKDLNLKFVLQVYRDYILTKDMKYVNDMFPQAFTVMKHALSWGAETDGMIKNSGFPDQTYDAWTMSGVSAYCGGLWIASLVVFVKMAEMVGLQSVAEEFTEILNKAKVTYEEKLWNGAYYNFDSSGGPHSTSIMADQLCGLWYLYCCELRDQAFPIARSRQAVECIYNMNVCTYLNGSQGAVNGMFPDGRIDTSAVQSEEVWTGVSYALAALLIYEGFVMQGFQTAEGIYETVYEKAGLGYATPEGLIGLKCFRALSYMRPLSIWSMHLAILSKTSRVT